MYIYRYLGYLVQAAACVTVRCLFYFTRRVYAVGVYSYFTCFKGY